MHPLKSDFDHKLTEKLGVKVTKYHKESRLFQLIIKLEYTLRSFQIKFLSQFMVKIRFQGVHWKAEFLQISKLSLDMNFEQDLRQIIDLQTRRPFFWDTVYLNQKFLMTSVRVLLLPSIIKAMVRASKSLMVVGWGGLFDYSVSPGPFF